MCGITGWINLDTTKLANAEAVLHSMCETIVHRGPDSEGLWMDDTVALGMRRLSIIDLKTGDQPVFSEDKSVVVMMNGELYNYREVRAELENEGYQVRHKDRHRDTAASLSKIRRRVRSNTLTECLPSRCGIRERRNSSSPATASAKSRFITAFSTAN